MFIKKFFLLLYIAIFNIFIIKSILAEETIINFEDGSSYNGEVFEGKMDGKGFFVSAKNQNNQILKYNGDFKKGKFDGVGTLEFYNGDIYNGDFFEGVMHGKGTLKYKNGSVYEGLFVKGKKEGKGKILYSDGVIYSGDFINDKIDWFK